MKLEIGFLKSQLVNLLRQYNELSNVETMIMNKPKWKHYDQFVWRFFISHALEKIEKLWLGSYTVLISNKSLSYR